MPTAQRRSSLTFKGPAQPTRTRKAPAVLDPIVPRTSQAGKKRRRTSGAVASTLKGNGVQGSASQDGRRQPSAANAKKAPTKRRRPDPVEEDGSDEDEGDGDEGAVRAFERRVSRDVVSRRWRLLSSAAQDDMRCLVDQAVRNSMDEVFPHGSSSKSAQPAQHALASFADELDALLVSLSIPPLPTALAGARGKGKAREVDIRRVMAEKDLRRRTVDLQAALELEEADVDALQARVDEERRLLEQDEALLADFLSTMTQVTARRRAAVGDEKALNPLLRKPVAPRLPLPPARAAPSATHAHAYAGTANEPERLAARVQRALDCAREELAAGRAGLAPSGAMGAGKGKGKGRKVSE